jgi:hypothetical protein
MNIALYDSLNEKVRLCNNCLNGLNGKLTKRERKEILTEKAEYLKEMESVLND